MGSTHSHNASSTGGSSTASGAGCWRAVHPSSWGQLLAKLRRRLSKKRRHGGFQRGCVSRTALLRPMPRCSSYGSCSTLLTPSKQLQLQKKKLRQQQQQQQQPAQKLTIADSNYAQWKCMFENSAGKQMLATGYSRPHDITEILSGQTTPRGFPSHTDARRCPLPESQLDREQPLYDEWQVKRKLSFRLPGSNQSSIRRLSARQKADQARLEQQLQRELRDLEEYYGAFHYARRNERRI